MKLAITVLILLAILISGCIQFSSPLQSTAPTHIDFGKFELIFTTLAGSDGTLTISVKNNESGPITLTSATANLDGNDIVWTFVDDYRQSKYVPSGEIRSPVGIVTSGKWIVHTSDSDTYSMNLTIYYTFNGQNLSSSRILSHNYCASCHYINESTTSSSSSSLPPGTAILRVNVTGFGKIQVIEPWDISGTDGTLRLNIQNKEDASIALTSATANINGADIVWALTGGSNIPSGNTQYGITGTVSSGNWIAQNMDLYSIQLTIFYTYNGQTSSSIGTISKYLSNS